MSGSEGLAVGVGMGICLSWLLPKSIGCACVCACACAYHHNSIRFSSILLSSGYHFTMLENCGNSGHCWLTSPSPRQSGDVKMCYWPCYCQCWTQSITNHNQYIPPSLSVSYLVNVSAERLASRKAKWLVEYQSGSQFEAQQPLVTIPSSIVKTRINARRWGPRSIAIRGSMWCGVVWCGVLWCGVVWCGWHSPSYRYYLSMRMSG
jgi:hypothetical protein